MKNIIIIALILALAYVTYRWLSWAPDAEKDKGIADTARQVTNLEVEKVNRKIGQGGLNAALVADKENLVSSISRVRDSARKEMDSVARLLGIKDSRILYYQSLYATTRDSLLLARKTPDGYDYRDKWAYLKFTNPTLTDSAKFSFQYNAEVNMLEYWARDNFLSPKRKYIDLWLSDPRATINSVKRLKIEPTPKRFSLHVQALGDYHPIHGAGLGAGARVQMGRVGLQGAYLYDGKQWYPAFRGSYDLIAW